MINTNKIRLRESYSSPIGKTNENTNYKKTYLDESGKLRYGIVQMRNYWTNEVLSQFMFYKNLGERIEVSLDKNLSLDKCIQRLELIKN
ncbi:hypothetical protein N9N09_00680 [Flavobacteriaceae bacterium]|nr:hypothetical protein [Flavobacteriaceae bacterium]